MHILSFSFSILCCYIEIQILQILTQEIPVITIPVRMAVAAWRPLGRRIPTGVTAQQAIPVVTVKVGHFTSDTSSSSRGINKITNCVYVFHGQSNIHNAFLFLSNTFIFCARFISIMICWFSFLGRSCTFEKKNDPACFLDTQDSTSFWRRKRVIKAKGRLSYKYYNE